MKIKEICTYSTALFAMTLILWSVADAQVMQSSNYGIQFDSVNSGGGYSTSSSYGLEDSTGQNASGFSTSTNYGVNAGYQQASTIASSSISISSPTNTSLGALAGLFGANSSATTSWTVITDNTAGYQVTIRASTTPALKAGSYSFADYVSSGVDPDYTFSVGAASSTFGFSPEGSDIIQKYRDNGSACNAGSGDTADKCWDGLSTTDKLIVEKHSANAPAGSDFTVRYRAGIGANKIQEAGDYSAYITVTATTL
jgi:hypothetical protein